MAITMTATLMRRISMRLIACLVLANFDAAAGWAQGPKYPPLSEYMMAPEAEVALARSAAPEKVSAHATVKILTTSGYKVADRKSTRLNSSHGYISYAVFCLKKKKTNDTISLSFTTSKVVVQKNVVPQSQHYHS